MLQQACRTAGDVSRAGSSHGMRGASSRIQEGRYVNMSERFQVKALGDHDYLVRVHEAGEMIETLFQVSSAMLDQLHLVEADEQRVVEETAAFLAERQPVIDLPQMIDLEDVAAAYGDFLDELDRRLRS
ncbi:hypothetical protein ACFWNT_19525 [Streptomyces sp. NPDC058409]|uniref:hypothetical protein n=1 Tax=Streptomyces sp. NPDC058409 TaxID=3346484 RepID=UPI00364847B3